MKWTIKEEYKDIIIICDIQSLNDTQKEVIKNHDELIKYFD